MPMVSLDNAIVVCVYCLPDTFNIKNNTPSKNLQRTHTRAVYE